MPMPRSGIGLMPPPLLEWQDVTFTPAFAPVGVLDPIGVTEQNPHFVVTAEHLVADESLASTLDPQALVDYTQSLARRDFAIALVESMGRYHGPFIVGNIRSFDEQDPRMMVRRVGFRVNVLPLTDGEDIPVLLPRGF